MRDEHVEVDLVTAVRSGDRDAWRRLYDTYVADIYSVAYRVTENSADARDVVQDVVADLPRRLVSFDGRGSLGAWLTMVTTRTAVEKLRARNKRRERENRAGAARFGGGRPLSFPVAIVDLIALERALATLPVPLRAVLILKDLEGYSHAEIGEILGVEPATSKRRLWKARRRLRAILSE